MSRAIAFIIFLCCSLFFACSSEDSSSTIEAPENSQAGTEGVTENPVEVDEEQSPQVPDSSPSTSPEIQEQILEPSGIIRTATEVIDASDLGGGTLTSWRCSAP